MAKFSYLKKIIYPLYQDLQFFSPAKLLNNSLWKESLHLPLFSASLTSLLFSFMLTVSVVCPVLSWSLYSTLCDLIFSFPCMSFPLPLWIPWTNVHCCLFLLFLQDIKFYKLKMSTVFNISRNKSWIINIFYIPYSAIVYSPPGISGST